MSIFSSSSSSSSSKFTVFSPSQNPNYSKFRLITPLKTPNSSPSHRILLHSHSHDSSPPALQEKSQNSASKSEMEEYGDGFDEEIIKAKKSLEELLVVRRPVMEESKAEAASENEIKLKKNKKKSAVSSKIDEGLSRFAKKMPIFEPKIVESGSEEKLLLVNLDLALYKAKLLARNYRFQEAEEILRKVNIDSISPLTVCSSGV